MYICLPVCLLSVPLPQWGGRELYIYINILIQNGWFRFFRFFRAILSFYTEYSLSICPSICLFLGTTGRLGDGQFTVTFRLVFQLSICMSVCLSICLLSVPLPQWKELYVYIDILIILSIDNLYICLSVPLAGRSRYVDISMRYILSKLRY